MADNSIPQNVIEILAEIRDGGRFNMFDQRNVMLLAYELDEDAGEWLDDNYGRYMDALNAMGAYVTAQKAASAAAPVSAEFAADVQAAATEYAPMLDALASAAAPEAASEVADWKAPHIERAEHVVENHRDSNEQVIVELRAENETLRAQLAAARAEVKSLRKTLSYVEGLLEAEQQKSAK